MDSQSHYAVFMTRCQEERTSLKGLIELMSGDALGIGTSVTLPKLNDATGALLLSAKQCVLDLETLLAAHVAQSNA
jgi:hypothetical protein